MVSQVNLPLSNGHYDWLQHNPPQALDLAMLVFQPKTPFFRFHGELPVSFHHCPRASWPISAVECVTCCRQRFLSSLRSMMLSSSCRYMARYLGALSATILVLNSSGTVVASPCEILSSGSNRAYLSISTVFAPASRCAQVSTPSRRYMRLVQARHGVFLPTKLQPIGLQRQTTRVMG